MEREELDDLMIIVSDLRMVQDLDERIEAGEGEVELISFADGERLMTTIPEEKRNRLKAKKGELSSLLKQKMAKIKD